MIRVVRKISDRELLILQDDKDYFLVVQTSEDIQPIETVVFSAYDTGRMSSNVEVDGEVGATLDQFLPTLLDKGYVSAPWDDDIPF